MEINPFNLSKNEQYIECHRPYRQSNGKYLGMIGIYELLNPSKLTMLTAADWSFEPKIVDPNATTGYNALIIDGQLVDLDLLVQDLCKSRLRVNKLGYCYFQIMRGMTDTEAYGFEFYRLNDMLKWSDYGVTIKLGKSNVLRHWDRLDILHGSTLYAKRIHQKDNIDKENDEQTAQVKLYVPKHLAQYYVPAVFPDLFIFKTLLNPLHVTNGTIVQHWGSKRDNFFATYTPTCVPVTATAASQAYSKCWITMKEDQSFDTDNWYFVGIRELLNPLLVYEGKMHSVNINGHEMSSPIDGSAYIYSSGPVFGPILLDGIGHRICLTYTSYRMGVTIRTLTP